MPQQDLTPERAAQILGSAPGASSPEERHRLFAEKRDLLEKKLAQAPTPGLKAKYRDALDELTAAFELLELSQTESDLGALRPDLKAAATVLPAAEVARGVPVQPGSAHAAKGPAAPASRHSKSQREIRLASMGVLVVVVVLGAWWWGHRGDAAAERAGRAELATITATVDAELAALDQQAAAVEREVSRMDSEARELARGPGGWELDYTRERKRLLADYGTWLKDYAVRHPARVARNAARELANGEPDAALAKAREAQVAIGLATATLVEARASKVGVALWTLAVRQRAEVASTALQRVAADEPESGKIWAADEKKRLAYLDTGKPRGDEVVRLQAIALALGPDDPDFLRWTPHLRPSKPDPSRDRTVSFSGAATLPLLWIGAGTFKMGSPAGEGEAGEHPQPEVTLSAGYWLGRYEVTQGQWQAVMGSNPSDFSKVGATAPVENVSWEDAMEFCRKLTASEKAAGRLSAGYEYKLPTEAEWENACRASTSGDYAGDLGAMAWYDANSGNTTHAVGQKRANAWGLHDMHGNVWEWCRDWYGTYPTGAVTDPTGPTSGSDRVSRGGCWGNPAPLCRSALRIRLKPGLRGRNLGFRLALSSIP